MGPKILQKPNSSSNRSIPCSSQRTSQGLGPTPKRQNVRSSRSHLPKNQEPYCSMEIVLRTNGLQGQSQLGKMLGFKKVKTFSLHYLSLRYTYSPTCLSRKEIERMCPRTLVEIRQILLQCFRC